MDSKDIKKLLDFDALQEAENITGKSYKDDKETESLGCFSHIQHNKIKNNILSGLGDSTLITTEEDYVKIVTSIGFESALVEPFTNRDGVEERLHIMWYKEYSILLVFDTHTWGDDGSWAKCGREVPPPSVNGGNFYYNWSPNTGDRHNYTSSGSYVGNGDKNGNRTYTCLFNSDFTPHHLPEEIRSKEPVVDWDNYEEYRAKYLRWCKDVNKYIETNNIVNIWCGDHDCREAVCFNVKQLSDNGTFLKKWKSKPLLWLLHYMDKENPGYNYDEVTAERMSKLPKHILDCINS